MYPTANPSITQDQYPKDNTEHPIPPKTQENHMRSTIKTLVIAIIALVLFIPTTANADTNGIAFSQATFNNTITDHSVAVSNATSSSKTIVLVDVKVSTKGAKNCKSNVTGYNSGRNASGGLTWFKDTKMRVCKSSKSPTGWIKVGGGLTGRNCGNPVRFSKPKVVVPRSRVKLLRKWKFTATVTATATAKVNASAKATCTANGASASSDVFATGTASAKATATASASSKASATASASAKAINASIKERTKINAGAVADATVKISGNASAFCYGAPPVITPPDTPPTTPPLECPPGSTPNNAGTECYKDGSTTPAPPAEAPGPNPAPADNTSSKCYSETTGLPVAPKSDGTCPAGSFG